MAHATAAFRPTARVEAVAEVESKPAIAAIGASKAPAPRNPNAAGAAR
jgi:hypothetical protein